MVYLIGASGHAKVIKNAVELNGLSVHGVYDDNDTISFLMDAPRCGNVSDINLTDAAAYIISIGNNTIRKKIGQKYADLNYIKVIHPQAVVDSSSQIQEGTVLMAGAIVNAACTVGKHVILNTGCTVDHDCIVEDYVHISPNATLSGSVHVGEGTHIGAGAVVIQGIRIGKWATVGAGAVVIRDVPDGAKVVGNPARPIGNE